MFRLIRFFFVGRVQMVTDSYSSQVEIPANCKAIGSCIDYKAYAFQLPRQTDLLAWKAVERQLMTLGKPEPLLTGVTRVTGSWGFLVVPPRDFPELKVNFYHQVKGVQQTHILRKISEVLYALTGG